MSIAKEITDTDRLEYVLRHGIHAASDEDREVFLLSRHPEVHGDLFLQKARCLIDTALSEVPA